MAIALAIEFEKTLVVARGANRLAVVEFERRQWPRPARMLDADLPAFAVLRAQRHDVAANVDQGILHALRAQDVGRSIELVDLLRNELTPHVCFGFGSVLGMIRDGDMIAHDDDMDLIVALPARRRLTFRKVLTELRALLRRHDYAAAESANLNHVSTARNRQAGTDVFIGFIDPDRRVSWFPSRRGSLNFGDVFPVASMRFFDHDCPVPRDPLKYLEATYGPDWRTPIPSWNHAWDASQYRDFI